jgi:hypothetical protein
MSDAKANRRGRSNVTSALRAITTFAITLLIAFTVTLARMIAAPADPNEPAQPLASPESFAAIGDSAARSAALFTEAAKVLTHPRCMNCHPAGDRPRQGDMRRLHQPPVVRGEDGFGLPAMRCSICHQQANFDPGRVPGDPAWHLAPHEMGWEGKTVAQICEQIKDPARNGGRSLEDIVHHVGDDHLVGWAWAPGTGRQPAPGTQAQAGALLDAWAKTGAVCPN